MNDFIANLRKRKDEIIFIYALFNACCSATINLNEIYSVIRCRSECESFMLFAAFGDVH